jgi:hypothetical protein
VARWHCPWRLDPPKQRVKLSRNSPSACKNRVSSEAA